MFLGRNFWQSIFHDTERMKNLYDVFVHFQLYVLFVSLSGSMGGSLLSH